jgi:hypothetical protein
MFISGLVSRYMVAVERENYHVSKRKFRGGKAKIRKMNRSRKKVVMAFAKILLVGLMACTASGLALPVSHRGIQPKLSARSNSLSTAPTRASNLALRYKFPPESPESLSPASSTNRGGTRGYAQLQLLHIKLRMFVKSDACLLIDSHPVCCKISGEQQCTLNLAVPLSERR